MPGRGRSPWARAASLWPPSCSRPWSARSSRWQARRGPRSRGGARAPFRRGLGRSRPGRPPRQFALGPAPRRARGLPPHCGVERRRSRASLGSQAMPTLKTLCLKLVRWTGWLLVPFVLAFFATGFAMSGRYGFGMLADERTALTLHKLMHAPLLILVVAHVAPSLYLAMHRWGWIKQRSGA